MSLRALALGLVVPLLAASGAAAGDVPSPDELRPEKRPAEREPLLPRFRWGIPDSPFPLMEAERKLFGFHLEFKFGSGEARRRDRPIR
jgi:hypothetical protein